MTDPAPTDEAQQVRDETFKQLKALQDRFHTGDILDEVFKDMMVRHQEWTKAFGPTVSGIALQEILVAVVGRVIALSQDPVTVLKSFDQMLLNTVAYYVNRQSRPDALQILSELMQLGATVQASADQRKTLA